MALRILKKTNGYMGDIYDEDGIRRRTVFKNVGNPKDAEKAYAIWRSKILKEGWTVKIPRKRFKDFVTEIFLPYSKLHKKSYDDDRFICQIVTDFFKGKFLHEITPAMIEAYQRHRLESPLKRGGKRSNASVNREFNTLSKIFSLAVRHDLLKENPCHKVKRLREADGRTRYISVDEEKKLMLALDVFPRAKQVLSIALYSGMRLNEILSLKWHDVDLERKIIFIRNTKNDLLRSIPIIRQVEKVLLELQPENNNGFVFRQANTKPQWLYRAYWTALTTVGIQNLRIHDLRHSAASRLADAGVHIIVIAEILGHKDLKTTKRYTHATDPAKREAMARLSQYGQN